MKNYKIVITALLALTLSQNVYAFTTDDEVKALDFCTGMGNVTELSVTSVKGGFSFEKQRKAVILDKDLAPEKKEQGLNSINYAEKHIELFYDLSPGTVSSLATYKCMKEMFTEKGI